MIFLILIIGYNLHFVYVFIYYLRGRGWSLKNYNLLPVIYIYVLISKCQKVLFVHVYAW